MPSRYLVGREVDRQSRLGLAAATRASTAGGLHIVIRSVHLKPKKLDDADEDAGEAGEERVASSFVFSSVLIALVPTKIKKQPRRNQWLRKPKAAIIFFHSSCRKIIIVPKTMFQMERTE